MAHEDERYLGRALDLAERGRGSVRPNPVVGCVLVRDGHVVGEGWHERAGGPHAEIRALEDADGRARDATAYVSLEPCRHHGRTPPCSEALVAEGISRVVFGAHDAKNGGADILREAGVDVVGGVRETEARAQNEVFFHVLEIGRPHVTLKLAQTLDGKAAAGDRSSRWITSPEARRAGHELRASADAVLVGSGTVLADDPRLDVRDVSAPAGQPHPVVLDSSGRIPDSAAVARPGAIVLTGEGVPDTRVAALSDAGADVVTVARTAQGLDLREVLAALFERDVRAVLVEGGPTVAGSFLREELVDRVVAFVAPAVLGGQALASVLGPGGETMDELRTYRFDAVSRTGPDVQLVARPVRERPPADLFAAASTRQGTG